jgi:hypothetical protein
MRFWLLFEWPKSDVLSACASFGQLQLRKRIRVFIYELIAYHLFMRVVCARK